MKHLDLFSGIGGFALAARQVWKDDYQNVGHSDVETFPCQVYHQHFPKSQCLGDIRKVQWTQGQADIVTGGFPCPAFSRSGKRGGFAQDDLFFELVRTVREVRPRFCVAENVEGFLPYAQQLRDSFQAIDYFVEDAILDARDFGIPQARRRYFAIAIRGDLCSDSQHLWRFQREQSEGLYRVLPNIENTQGRGASTPQTKDEWRALFANSRRVREDNGVPYRMDRLKALGNAICPAVAVVLFEAIKSYEES